MTQYARVHDAIVVELFTPPDGVPIEDCFTPEIAATFVPVPADVPVEPGWTYDGTTFAPPGPPPPPTADQELGTRKANGIAITCTSDATINATYALDDRTVATVGSIARDVASGLDFPAGATTYDQPDIDGVPHTFTEPQWIALYKAMRDMVSALAAQRDVMAGGGTPVWPDQSATIP